MLTWFVLLWQGSVDGNAHALNDGQDETTCVQWLDMTDKWSTYTLRATVPSADQYSQDCSMLLVKVVNRLATSSDG